jgi:hypothetical protein
MTNIIYPAYIQLGTYCEGNVRRIKFNKNNPRHVRMFYKFYNIKPQNDEGSH